MASDTSPSALHQQPELSAELLDDGDLLANNHALVDDC